MNRRFLIILAGLAIIIIAISGFAGSMNAKLGGVSQASQPVTGTTVGQENPADTVSSNGFSSDTLTFDQVPADQFTLGNAPGHRISQ